MTDNSSSSRCRFALPRPVLRLATVLMVTFSFVSGLIAADATPRMFDLPAGDAVDTLKQAAQQAGFEIMFPAESVRGVRTNPVRGTFSAREAIDRMIAGTDLYVVEDQQSGALSVRRVAADSSPPSPPGPGGRSSDTPVILSAFEVEESRQRGYQATSTSSATRLNTPIVELSKNIQILTRDLLDDLKVTELNEAMYLSASVSQTSQYSGRLAVRGFENATAKRNGLGNYGADETITDTATIERIEIVKGPSSLLYGSSSPGGVVNYETKKPLSYHQDSIRTIVGSWDKYRVEIDSGGPLIGEGKLLNYRLVAAYEDTQSYGANDESERGLVAGTLRWFLTPNTYLLIGGEINRSRRTSIRPGVYPISATTFNPDGTRTYNNVGYILTKESRRWTSVFTTPQNKHDSDVNRLDLDLSHKFTDDLNLFVHYNYIDNQLVEAYGISGNDGYDYGLPVTAPNYPARDELLLPVSFRNPHRKSHNGTVTLNYDFKTDWMQSQVIAGWEYYSFDLLQGDYQLKSDFWPVVNFRTGAGYNELNFANTYEGVIDGVGKNQWSILNRYNRTQEYNAPYLLLHNYFFDRRLRVIAGVRRDDITIKQTFRAGAGTTADPFAMANPTFTNSKASATTPMIGASVSPFKNQPGLALYANYSESLVANEIVNPDGSTLPPENGNGLEAGIKLDLTNKLSATLSWFTIDKTNLARGVPNTVPQEWVASGLQRSKGVDLDVFYAVTPDWQIMASGSVLNARFVNDGDANLVGTRIGAVPRWAWSIWNKYTFSSGPLKGFNIGGGAVSHAEMLFENANYPALIAPEFVRFDLLVGYTMEISDHEWEFSVKVNNLTDKVYLIGKSGYGEPRGLLTTVTVRF